MKKIFSISFLALSSQILLAHPGEHHTHTTFMAEWAWLIVPAVAVIFLVFKYAQKQVKKSKN